jgi:hypothetical protein
MYPRVISFLFFFFFTCVVLNPQVGTMTIYLYLFIPFLDPSFTRFCMATIRRWSIPLAVALAVTMIGSPMAGVRVASIAICIGYLLYAKERKIFYLHHWMMFNIGFATIQFVLWYVDQGLAIKFGPRAVAQLVWGDFATPAYTNFFEVFFFARVSGLSREAGFFSSLLVASLCVYLMTEEKRNKWIVMAYFYGLVISFSKSSMLLFVFAALYPFRNQLRTTHPLIVFCIFAVGVTGFSVFLAQHNFYGSDTFGHRFGGYPFMLQARLEDIMFGINAQDVLKHYKYLDYIRLIEPDIEVANQPFAGLPSVIADMGIFSAVLLFGLVAFTASDGFVLLLLLLISSTVSITTVTSFVPLGYLLLYWPRFKQYVAQKKFEAWRRASSAAFGRPRPTRSLYTPPPRPGVGGRAPALFKSR